MMPSDRHIGVRDTARVLLPDLYRVVLQAMSGMPLLNKSLWRAFFLMKILAAFIEREPARQA
jgi:hypothetical protein